MIKKTKTEKIYFAIFGVAVFAWLLISIDFINDMVKNTDRNETKHEFRPLTAEEFEKLKAKKFETDLKNLTENFSKLSDDNWSISALDINKTGLEIDTNITNFEEIVK